VLAAFAAGGKKRAGAFNAKDPADLGFKSPFGERHDQGWISIMWLTLEPNGAS
jgi:hypothetical protein